MKGLSNGFRATWPPEDVLSIPIDEPVLVKSEIIANIQSQQYYGGKTADLTLVFCYIYILPIRIFNKNNKV